jgi:replicative DNA helicase
MAEIIIAKHRNGAVGDVLLRFRGEFARFQNPDDESLVPMPGEEQILGSRMNSTGNEMPPPPPPPTEGMPFGAGPVEGVPF